MTMILSGPPADAASTGVATAAKVHATDKSMIFVDMRRPLTVGFFAYADMRHAEMARSFDRYRNWFRPAVFRATFFFGFWLILYGVKSPDFVIGASTAIAASCLHPWPEKRFLVTIQGGSPVR